MVLTNFEGGNGLLKESGPENYVKVESELKPGDTRNVHFHCQVINLDNNIPLQFELEAEFVGNTVFYSYDNVSWTRSDSKVNDIFTIPIQNGAVYVSHFQPYVYSRVEQFLDDLENQNHDFISIEEVATSQGGLPVRLVKMTDPCIEDTNKKIIWVLCRQHAGEHPASYVTEGMMEAFAQENFQMNRLRQEAVVYVVPMMDVDMPFVGGTGKDQNPVDFNRDWTSPTHDSHWDVVAVVKQMMEDTPNEMVLFLDMHTFAPGEPANVHIALDLDDQLLLTQNFIERTNFNGGQAYDILPWTDINLDVSQDYVYEFHGNPNLLSLTPETAFELAPDGTMWTAQKLLDQGVAFAKASSDYVNGLDKPLEQILDNNDPDVEFSGSWMTSTNFPGYYSDDYLYANADSDASFTFSITPPSSGLYGISTYYSSDENRADNVQYELSSNGIVRNYILDQTILGSRWRHIDTMTLQAETEVTLTINANNSNGFVIADAFRIYPIPDCPIPTSSFDINSNNTNIICYPNPSAGEINLEISEDKIEEGQFFKIYNKEGKLIQHATPFKNKMKWNIHNKGLFFIYLFNKKKELVSVEKVIIK